MPEQLSSENHMACVLTASWGLCSGLALDIHSRTIRLSSHCRDPVGMQVLTLGSFHPAQSHPSFYPAHLLAQQPLLQYSPCYHLRFVKSWKITPWRAELIILIFRKTEVCLLVKKTLIYNFLYYICCKEESLKGGNGKWNT